MHPQNEHSPPTRRSSTMATDSPPSAQRPAAFSPGGPAPITITSNASLAPFAWPASLISIPPPGSGDRPIQGVERYTAPNAGRRTPSRYPPGGTIRPRSALPISSGDGRRPVPPRRYAPGRRPRRARRPAGRRRAGVLAAHREASGGDGAAGHVLRAQPVRGRGG